MKKNVLLVDDDQIFNFINKKTLEGIGYVNQIHSALNGKEALDLINDYYSGIRSLPDVIFLDLNMPMMDGFQFIEVFQKLNLPEIEKVLIIIVTSSDNPQDIQRARELGIKHYLTKPISEESIKAVLESKN